MSNYVLIDADSHVTEPADTWTARVPARYLDQVPHVVKDEAGKDVWMLGGVQIYTVGATSAAGFPGFPAARPQTYEDLHPGSYDAGARLRYLDEAGIWAQVLRVASKSWQPLLQPPNAGCCQVPVMNVPLCWSA